jgi:predicted CoA-binding protein
MKSTLVLGASPNPGRYAHMAIHRLRGQGHEVFALGRKGGTVADIEIATDRDELALPEDLDTVTMYLNPWNQEQYVDWILDLAPKRVIFNPGSENPSLAKQLQEKEVEPVFACTLVMLGTGQF